MDEAEVLSTRIAIMAHGKLRCIANQQRLKNIYGGGYKLSCTFADGQRDTVFNSIRAEFPSAEIASERRNQIMFKLSKKTKVSYVFDKMEAMENVQRWGCGQVGLRDVFAEIVETYKSSRKT